MAASKRQSSPSTPVTSAAKNISSQNTFEAIMENTEVQLAYLDSKFNFIRVNSAYAKGSGFSKKQLIGNNHFQLFPNKENIKIFRDVVKTGKGVKFHRQQFVFPEELKKGATYWDWTLTPVKNNQQQIEGLVLSLVDVSKDVISDQERENLVIQLEKERQRAEQLTIEAEKRAAEMDAIFMAMPDPLVVYDLSGRAVSANPAALLTFGFDPVGKRGNELMKILKISHPDGKPASVDEIAVTQALKGQTIISRPFTLTNIKNEKVAVLVSASPIFNEKMVAGAAIVMHDVSERLKLERQKDEFIAIASHELKTPITTLKAFTQILQKRLENTDDKNNHPANGEISGYLERMNNQLNKLSSLVKELLDVSRIESGLIPLQMERFDFDEAVYNTTEDLQRITRRHRLIVRGRTNKKIWGDKNRINQIITNLILNATKYSPLADKIIIHLLGNKHNVIVKIKDFGIGIAKDNQAKIFDRFFRVKGSSGERFPGLGLGLYISAEIAKAHGGRMWLKSTVGKGSTFFFCLPVRKRKVQNG